ncbi:hypothetical protein ACIRBZ_24510 [Streptomyces sp. NPDC094038]|uniref:hypothetical protein n=1 Tax=Streptomyces sp. NPDC094038 TaxID=3366055 RepID=UPI00380D96A6
MSSFDLAGTSAPWVVMVTEGTAGIRRQLAGLTASSNLVHYFDGHDRTSGTMTTEFSEFDREKIAARVEQPDLITSAGDGFVGAALKPEVWH